MKIKKPKERSVKVFIMVSTIFLLALGMYFTISVLTYNKTGKNKSNEDVIKRSTHTSIDYEKLYKMIHKDVDENLEGKRVLTKYSLEQYIYKNNKGLNITTIDDEAYTDILTTNYDFSKYEGKIVNKDTLDILFNSINYSIFGNYISFNSSRIICSLATLENNSYNFNTNCGDTSTMTAHYRLEKALEDENYIYLYENVIYESMGNVYSHYRDNIDDYLVNNTYKNPLDNKKYVETYKYSFKIDKDGYHLYRVEYQ